jgi:hypothetical protein
MTNFDVNVNWRDGGMSRGLDELSRKVNNLEDQINRLSRAEANPNIRIDIREAEAKLKEFQADLQRLQDARVQITADTARVRAEINNVQNDLRRLRSQPTSVKVDADIAAAEAKLKALQEEARNLKTQRLNFDADTAAVSAKISELKAKLDTLRDVHINVNLDTGAATAKATAFRAALSGLGRDGNVFSNSLKAISGALGPVVSGFGGAVSSVGNFISAIGGGVGVISGLGNAISSIGSSISSAGQAFSALASGASGAFGALASATASISLAVTQLGLLAGAVAVAGGALGQLGGAAVALGSGIVPVVQSLGLLPGLLAPIGIGLATLAIGFSNSGKSGMEFKNTMDQLKGAFQPVIDSIRSQMQPAIQNLLNSFKGLAPVIQAVVPQITSAVSQVANSFAQLFQSSSFKSDLQQFLSSAAQNIKVFGDAAKNAFQGFINVVMAAQPAVDRFAKFLDDGVQKWNAWTAAARQSGELTTIFNQAEQALEQIIGTIGNLAGLFVDLWNKANSTGAFQATLQAINQGITQFRQYVTQAGGAWDTLMSKAGSVTQSIIGLIGSIGNAFVELGGKIDISATIDKISQAIQRITPALTTIGQQANTVFQQLIDIAGRAGQALGPGIAQSIQAFGNALKQINWEAVITGVSGVIQVITNLFNVLAKGPQLIQDFETLINKIETGDFSGMDAAWKALSQDWDDIQKAMTNTSGIDAAKQGVQGLNAEIQGIKPPPPINFSASDNASPVAIQVGHNITAVPGNWVTKFLGDVQGLLNMTQQGAAAVKQVPETHNTTLNADGAALIAAATQGKQAIQGVVPEWLTKFAGDAANLVQTAQQADQTASAVANKAYTVKIGADAGGVQTGVGQANTSLGSLQDKTVNITATDNASTAIKAVTDSLTAIVDKTFNITANNDDALQKIQAVQTALQGLVDKNINIIVNNQQALQAIQQVQSALDNLHDKTVTVTTNYVTTGTPPGQAAGSILEPMARGGITYGHSFGNLLPMARGGHFTPMSGHQARIVQPNTFRIIGDRTHDAEAFIPINRSPRSRALLHETARRMGEVAIPKQVIHFHRGGYWDWFRRNRPQPLPQQLMQTVGPPNVSSFGVGSSVGLSGSALPIKPATLSTYFNPGTRSIANASPPSVPGGRPRQVYVNSSSAIIQELLRMIRAEVRKQGGDVQVVLGN